MKKSRLIGFNANELAESMMANAVTEQNRRLIEYAQKGILELGYTIASISTKNNMDDTGNLLDSLCWGVCYNGEMIGSGFYREQRATRPSELHAYSKAEVLEGRTRRKWKELYNTDVQKARMLQAANWSETSASEPVNGHELAQAYIDRAAKKCKAGQWMVFFAILAPYWGYWEAGHNNVFMRRFVRYQVITEFYDKMKTDLKPAKVKPPHIHVEKYASKSLYASAKKNLKDPHRFDSWLTNRE